MTGSPSPPVVFVAWTSGPGRARDIAAALGGEAWTFKPTWLSARRLAPLRWCVSALATVAYLLRRHPRAVIVTNPPIWAPLVAFPVCRLLRMRFVLDSHPGGFGAMGDSVAARMQPLHAWLARRAEAVLVTTPDWVRLVSEWGGRGLVIHEAPVPWQIPRAGPPSRRLRVLAVGTFGGDEPVAELVAAVRDMQDVDMRVTGDVARAPRGLLASAPPHVRFVGYLSQADYVAAISDADVVLVLSTDPTSIPRSACESVWAGRPLVLSDSAATRQVFPYAVHVDCTPEGIASGIRQASLRHEELRADAEKARLLQQGLWQTQMKDLQLAVGRYAPGLSPGTSPAASPPDNLAGQHPRS